MKGLSAEARRLLQAAQEFDEPTASERRRSKRALMAATLAASAASGASSAAAATGGVTNAIAGLGFTAKLALVVGALAVTGAVAPKLVDWAHTPEPAPVVHTPRLLPQVTPPTPSTSTPPTVETANGESPALASPAVAPPEPAPNRRPVSVRRSSRAPSSRHLAVPSVLEARDARPTEPAAPADLRGELLLLAQAQRARAHGDPARALASLREHARRFPHGQLSPEREAARVLALRALGRDAEANHAQARFLSHHPNSPLATRLSSGTVPTCSPHMQIGPI